jgi:hypothetical protein
VKKRSLDLRPGDLVLFGHERRMVKQATKDFVTFTDSHNHWFPISWIREVLSWVAR